MQFLRGAAGRPGAVQLRALPRRRHPVRVAACCDAGRGRRPGVGGAAAPTAAAVRRPGSGDARRRVVHTTSAVAARRQRAVDILVWRRTRSVGPRISRAHRSRWVIDRPPSAGPGSCPYWSCPCYLLISTAVETVWRRASVASRALRAHGDVRAPSPRQDDVVAKRHARPLYLTHAVPSPWQRVRSGAALPRHSSVWPTHARTGLARCFPTL